MKTRDRVLRAGIGLLVAALLVGAGFAVVLQVIPTWGATAEEVARTLPGDEIVPNPLVKWTHGITINAPVDEVWGWVSQIGEGRGGFYSYTFIENQMGNGDVYHNAERIVPEWQNPATGTVMIRGGMEVRALEPGKWYLGASTNEMGWSWLWYLEPLDANQTRLVVRSHIKPAGGMSDNTVGTVLNLGGFVMEQAMLQGIQARAEGNVPPAYAETLAVVLWMLAFAAGVIAAVCFVTFREWHVPMVAGLVAIVALLIFTFVQPALWICLLADVVLYTMLGAFALSQYNARRMQPRSGRRTAEFKLNPNVLK